MTSSEFKKSTTRFQVMMSLSKIRDNRYALNREALKCLEALKTSASHMESIENRSKTNRCCSLLRNRYEYSSHSPSRVA